ncbi:MAG: DUF4386 domain-containing protein, partial [Micromonosporaceae bacterium]|nr:DUF4386 domain-containing protein [Micromonosporaceae bacterium]
CRCIGDPSPATIIGMTARRHATAAGVLYLITHVTSITALILYGPVLNNTDYIVSGGADGQIQLGALLEGILAICVIGTSVALFPIVRRQNESMALGVVGLRILEAGAIVAGLISLLAVVSLRDAAAAGADRAARVAIGQALVAFHDWTFLIGPNLALSVSTMLLAYLVFRSHLVPRWIGALGMAGGTLIFIAAIGELFGLFDQVSIWGFVLAVPVFAWELSFAFWMIIKGFRPSSPILAQSSPVG